MRLFKLLGLFGLLHFGCFCNSSLGSYVAETHITIIATEVGNGLVKRITGIVDPSSMGIFSTAVTLNGGTVPINPTSPHYAVDLVSNGDTIVITLGVESNCSTAESFLSFEFNLEYQPNNGAGEGPQAPELMMSGMTSATDMSVLGESGSSESSVGGLSADSSGTTSASGSFQFLGPDDPLFATLSAESECTPVPEPSPVALLGLIFAVSTLRRRFTA